MNLTLIRSTHQRLVRSRDRDVIMDGTVERLLTKLKDVAWTWSKAGAEQVIASLGARMVQGVPGRSTYETVEGPRLSLYSEGALAELVEITLEAFQDPHLLSEVEYERKANEFLQKFRAAVAVGTRSSVHLCSTMVSAVTDFPRTGTRSG